MDKKAEIIDTDVSKSSLDVFVSQKDIIVLQMIKRALYTRIVNKGKEKN